MSESEARRDELADKAIGVWTRQPGRVWCGSLLLSTAVQREEDGDKRVILCWEQGEVEVIFRVRERDDA